MKCVTLQFLLRCWFIQWRDVLLSYSRARVEKPKARERIQFHFAVSSKIKTSIYLVNFLLSMTNNAKKRSSA